MADGRGAREVGDRELAALLADEALMEMRSVARRARVSADGDAPAEAVVRLGEAADFCRDMLLVSRSSSRRPFRSTPSRRQRAMAKRPMSYRWQTYGPERRAWILDHVERAGLRWTPPPPLPTPRKGPPTLGLRQRLAMLAGWPVRTPPGRRRLPRRARVLKAVDSGTLRALYEEAEHRRLGLGKGGAWLDTHLMSDATHFLFPDPADYYWPDPDAGRPWWQCRVLLRMVDGEQVNGLLAVMPETYVALPSTVPRPRQHLIARTARLTERDTYLWGRDHKAGCGPGTCGYRSPVEERLFPLLPDPQDGPDQD
ncbi:hypothetical protein DMB38_16970 [Streptomyces sp. WAC 06738]|uniref:hypothetical protein n=1 Tax=Streptomyces sp. WAC 06738 TaxID=2203210 RepID=UPI000F7175B2|nr:hypothetical protein [Streptomyces sp. WAC 06738]AZM47261.1 hypothetical protein DMB38_16970 [Streptomyces sp. WAC 06738]